MQGIAHRKEDTCLFKGAHFSEDVYRGKMILINTMAISFFTLLTPVSSETNFADPYSQPSVSLTKTWDRSYRIGENFTLPCRLHLPKYKGTEAYGKNQKQFLASRANRYIASIEFVRLVDDQDTVISRGEQLSKTAEKSKRYTVTIIQIDNYTIKATLHIRNLIYSDGGRLGCKIGGDEYGLTAYTGSEVVVNVPITDVQLGQLTSNSTYLKLTRNADLHMTNTYRPRRSGFYCQVTVRGGSIQPKVTLFIGKKEVTKYCKKKVMRAWLNVNQTMERGYLVRYEFETLHPSWFMDGSRLLCKASVPFYPKKEAASKLNVTYSPSILCKEKAYTLRGSKNAVIKCRGRMNPPPTYAIWWWPQGLAEVVIPNGKSKHGYKAELKVLARGVYEFSLIIEFVSLSRFHWYTIEIDNGMGLRRKSIELVEGIDPDGTRSIHNQCDLTLMCLSVVTGYLTQGYGYV